jgi:hypothetical protein
VRAVSCTERVPRRYKALARRTAFAGWKNSCRKAIDNAALPGILFLSVCCHVRKVGNVDHVRAHVRGVFPDAKLLNRQSCIFLCSLCAKKRGHMSHDVSVSVCYLRNGGHMLQEYPYALCLAVIPGMRVGTLCVNSTRTRRNKRQKGR